MWSPSREFPARATEPGQDWFPARATAPPRPKDWTGLVPKGLVPPRPKDWFPKDAPPRHRAQRTGSRTGLVPGQREFPARATAPKGAREATSLKKSEEQGERDKGIYIKNEFLDFF